MLRNRQDVVIELEASSPSPATRLEGYPSFAQFIAQDGDAAIYRKYGHLSARNLLYLQSELHELEEQLQQLDREDVKDVNNEEAQKAAREWRYFSDTENGRSCHHRALQERIKTKLKEYHEAMLLENQVLALSAPTSRTLKAFKRWFIRDSVPVLWGRDIKLYDNDRDLVALAPVDTDRLNILLQNHLGWLFRESRPRDKEGYNSSNELFYYGNNGFSKPAWWYRSS
ncbi:hypothetical protein MMC30_005944 [Trapelia coarctata]|nr:hypothetical protein [Trapelia coarctata]